MTKRIVLLGYPLRHSISSAFQQAALDFYHLDIRYEAREREPAQLRSAVEELRSPDYLGANITIPHKESALRLVDDADETSMGVGAVNTIVCRSGRLGGCNTDVEGFLQALRLEGGFEPGGKRALLLGAGGAARAVAYALVKSGAASLMVANRTVERATALLAAMEKVAAAGGVRTEMVAVPWEKRERRKLLEGCHLIVNCTSMGMRHSPEEARSPLEEAAIPHDAFVYDLVYNPAETPLLRAAMRAGARTLGGLAMLVHQGARAFELWTGREAPLGVMFAAARRALAERGV
ncbi:MAG: shikimate dehydrogenase [Dehalococcoidia bacterium]|nr:shikimate dehydrogenase [Dehalococcoidia bacterium]